MADLTQLALKGISRDSTLRQKITIPEWSEYRHVERLEKILADVPDRGAVIEEWAEVLEVDPEVVRMIVDGDILTPRIALLTKLAEYLEIERDELVVPFEGWFTQISLEDNKKIAAWADGNEHKALCYTLIRKLEDEAGKPIFTVEHLPQLQLAPASLIASIAEQVSRRPSLKEQVKNS